MRSSSDEQGERDTLIIGVVARPHGIRGELRIHLYDAGSRTLLGVDELILGGELRRVRSARLTTGAVLLAVEGVADRTAAEKLRGAKVEVPRTAVPLAAGEFFVSDLIGCEAVEETGAPLGTVTAIMPGQQDLLVITDEHVERLVPLVPAFLRALDLGVRRVVLSLPEGLPVTTLGRGSQRKE